MHMYSDILTLPVDWAGHWRGSNATQETVICPRSFHIRRGLESLCNSGYTVSGSPLNTFWGVDLLHRVLHVPQISENVVDHFAENYNEVIELAESEPEKSVKDSDALQYFAVDVYAFDIAAPGVGCSGPQVAHNHSQSSTSSATYTASAFTTSVRSAAVSTTMQTMASLTTSAAAVSILYPVRG